MNDSKIEALISLLDDPDETIYKDVKEQILALGGTVIPSLEHAWENSFDSVMQERIEQIIHDIQFQDVVVALKEWKATEEQDLLQGCLILAKYQYPDLDEQPILDFLDQVTQDVWLEINDNLTALEKIRVVNRIIFDIHGLSGNKTNYHAPQNTYLNDVVSSKKGNPITLSIVYLIICERLNIPVMGVNLPQHFVMAYVTASKVIFKDKIEKEDVLFYINAFSKGFVFSDVEIAKFLKQLNLQVDEMFYLPCTNADIVERCINNLINSYDKLGHVDKKDELQYLKDQLSKDSEDGLEDDA